MENIENVGTTQVPTPKNMPAEVKTARKPGGVTLSGEIIKSDVEAAVQTNHFLKFKELVIKNGRVFKNLTVKLEKQGLVLVLGLNGSGKSTIWGLLESIFYSSTPNGHRRDELVKNKKDASFTVSFGKGPEELAVEYARTKMKWKHTITVDGKEKDYHSIPETTRQAAESLGMSRAEFEGSIHLTQSAQHILIEGKPSERKQYISDFFGIDERYDQVKAAAETELSEVTKEIEKVSSYSHTLTILEEEQKALVFQDVASLKKELVDLQESINITQSQIAGFEKDRSSAQLHAELAPKASVFQNPEQEKEAILAKIAELRNSQKQYLEIKFFNEEATKSNALRNLLITDFSNYQAQFPDISKNFREEFSCLGVDITTNHKSANLVQELQTFQQPLEQTPTAQLEEEFNRVSAESHYESKRLSSMQKGECPTCGTKFDSGDISKQIEKCTELLSTLASFKEDLVHLKNRNEKAIRYQYLKQATAGVPIITQADTERYGYLEKLLKAQERYLQIEQQLVHLHHIELKPEIDAATAQFEISSSDAKISQLNECISAKLRLPPQPQFPVEFFNVAISESHSQRNSSLTALQQRQIDLGKVETENSRLVKLNSQIQELKVKLDGMEVLKKGQYYWQKMVEAYGSKGLRVQQLQKIMDTVLQRLPYYTSILFEDKNLSFFHNCDSSNIDILAKRVNDSEEYTHDISSLSGGEKRALSVAFVLTLADCVNANKRSNILILDEVDSNLDASAQFRFVNHLLPILKEQYESVFLITHSEEIQQAAVYDKIWTVKKTGGWSTIEEKVSD